MIPDPKCQEELYDWIVKLRRNKCRMKNMPPRPECGMVELKPASPTEGPTLRQLATNAVAAAKTTICHRFATVSDEKWDANLAICRECDFWDATKWAGTGGCKHPKCGCTKLKQKLVGQRCPLDPPKWENQMI